MNVSKYGRHLILDTSDRCYLFIDKRENYYVIEILTDVHRISILCFRLEVRDFRNRHDTRLNIPLTRFMKTKTSERR